MTAPVTSFAAACGGGCTSVQRAILPELGRALRGSTIFFAKRRLSD